MEPFEFIDAKPDGTKERQLGATVQLYNKLSADEANRIRTKLNELVDAANSSNVPLFPLFALKFKGGGNTLLGTLEAGDIVHGFYDMDTIWDNAKYNGGDPNDKANYTQITTNTSGLTRWIINPIVTLVPSFTVNVTGGQGLINGEVVNNAGDVSFSVNAPTTGYTRLDLIVMDVVGDFIRVQGLESLANAAAPPIPIDSLLVTILNVSDSGATEIPTALYVPLPGTTSGNPISGDLEIKNPIDFGNRRIVTYYNPEKTQYSAVIFSDDGAMTFESQVDFLVRLKTNQNGIEFYTDNPDSQGIFSTVDFTTLSNWTDTSLVQKMYVDGLRGKFISKTTTQINAIATPQNGETYFNTTLSTLCFYDGSGWKRVSHSAM